MRLGSWGLTSCKLIECASGFSSTFRDEIRWALSPLSKLRRQMMALMMVRMMSRMVMTAKADGLVRVLVIRLVDSNKLENEV